MGLDPQAKTVLDGLAAMGLPPFETLSVEEARQFIQTAASTFMIPPEEVAEVVDRTIPGPEAEIPIRIYRPFLDEPRPAVLYFHGGGFCTGSIDMVDPICRALANRSTCAVIAVGYRLAPEHPYPAAVQDAYVATAWVAANGAEIGVDPNLLVVAGDSAGANLATVACMVAHDNADELQVELQILICPILDLVKADNPSYKEFGEGHLLDNGMIDWFKRHYLTGVEDRVAEPYCSPVRNPNLGGLPPAIILTAECDPLRDEAEAYGQILEMNGVQADIRRQDGMIHGFYLMGTAIDRGRRWIDEVGGGLRQFFS
jgi:acetyl esterase